MDLSNTQKIVAGSIVALVAVAGIILATTNIDNGESNNETALERVATDPADIENPGSLIEYSTESFANASESKKVLFFHSLTCVVCDQIERNMKAGVMPEDVALFIVRLEKEDDLIEKYSINQQTTFIQVDNEGNEIKEWNWLSKPFADPQDLELEVV